MADINTSDLSIVDEMLTHHHHHHHHLVLYELLADDAVHQKWCHKCWCVVHLLPLVCCTSVFCNLLPVCVCVCIYMKRKSPNQFNTNVLQKAPNQHEHQLGMGTDLVINSITEISCMFSLPLLWEAPPSLSSISETLHHADSLHAVWSNVCHAGGVPVSHTPTQIPVRMHTWCLY